MSANKTCQKNLGILLLFFIVLIQAGIRISATDLPPHVDVRVEWPRAYLSSLGFDVALVDDIRVSESAKLLLQPDPRLWGVQIFSGGDFPARHNHIRFVGVRAKEQP
ncbi:MAG: hypothetical protein NkDv07_0304 [Candidatus Improbicoccus devescovinae]|nr:MAG: hypothetical protein NkDv07_0304 [Candidatus Improbicoccus devescovinae]